MEWIVDPTAWVGLVTLIFLELILGIDNLVFIAILAQKLPPAQRDHARQIGLLLALGMRIVLLLAISWLAGLTHPLFSLFGKVFSWRDVILLLGGLFLLFKATNEIHSRIEGKSAHSAKSGYKAKFWMVVSQIIILDAVFSIDAVITAVGMVDHVSMMITAVSIAIVLMIIVSKPLTAFVNKHPTIVMLCLGFLLMVGFSLVAEGFGAEIPKGYLYAAIGFSVLIEAINQFAHVKIKRRFKSTGNMRQNAADTILKVLGAKPAAEGEEAPPQEIGAILQEASRVLSPAEKELLRGVLNLSERPVHSVMTPGVDVEYIDIGKSREQIFADIRGSSRSHLLVSDGEIGNVMGILRRDDYLLASLAAGGGPVPISSRMLHEPLYAPRKMPVIKLLEAFKKKPVELAVVTDDAGGVDGVVTHLDVLEAIAGEFPDRDDQGELSIVEEPDGSLVIDGMTSIYDVINKLGIGYQPDGRFATIAGLVLHDLGRFPRPGDAMEWEGYKVTVGKMDGRRIDCVILKKLPQA